MAGTNGLVGIDSPGFRESKVIDRTFLVNAVKEVEIELIQSPDYALRLAGV